MDASVPASGNVLPHAMARTVADLCHEHSIDVAELAKRSGLVDNRVAAIALGRWTPSPAERQKIAAVFGVAVDEIAWGHVTPIQHLYGHGPG
jgi:transcriptional regulator with XRE-family HTH domain